MQETLEAHRENCSRREVIIIVNGRRKEVSAKELSFDEIIALAFDDPPTGEFICFMITYRRGHENRPESSVVAGETVRIKEGMIFNVTYTDKS